MVTTWDKYAKKLCTKKHAQSKIIVPPLEKLVPRRTLSTIVLCHHHGSIQKESKQPPYHDLGEHFLIQGCF
jgi:hypothetical protein